MLCECKGFLHPGSYRCCAFDVWCASVRSGRLQRASARRAHPRGNAALRTGLCGLSIFDVKYGDTPFPLMELLFANSSRSCLSNVFVTLSSQQTSLGRRLKMCLRKYATRFCKSALLLLWVKNMRGHRGGCNRVCLGSIFEGSLGTSARVPDSDNNSCCNELHLARQACPCQRCLPKTNWERVSHAF